jgi:N-methylhydantoinase B
MKFSQNKLYIESYQKCPNCGNLMYEDSAADRAALVVHGTETYCSQRCVDWKIDRDKRRAAPGT